MWKCRISVLVFMLMCVLLTYSSSSFQAKGELLISKGADSTESVATDVNERVKVIIRFKKKPGLSAVALMRSRGWPIKRSYNLIPAFAATIPKTAFNVLKKNPLVAGIELDTRIYAHDAELDNTWGVKRIRAGVVHGGGNKGTGVKVALLDTGIDYNHPDLDDNYRGGKDFVNDDNNPMDDSSNSHGTHVAGTIAAEDNGIGVVGVAPEVELYALKVMDENGSGYFSDIIAALDWIVDYNNFNPGNPIRVTNNSYGSTSDPGSAVRQAFDRAAAAGVLHVASAGNGGSGGSRRWWRPSSTVGYPARYNSVMAIAATDQNDNRASWSSTGSQLELSGPGVSVNSTKRNGGYGTLSGTSMASPHVAGTAALVFALGITDKEEVRQILTSAAEDLGSLGRDNNYGFGLVDATAAVDGVGPVGPPESPEPAVNVNLSTDRTNYVSGQALRATLAAVVTNENGDAISGLSSGAFETTLNGSPTSVTFNETGTSGTYTGDIDISGYPAGNYTVEVTVTYTGGISGTDSATFTIDPAPSGSTIVSIDPITYYTTGSWYQRLRIVVPVKDGTGSPVSNASVSIDLYRDAQKVMSTTGITGGDGTVTFSYTLGWGSRGVGCYQTTATNVSGQGLTWDGVLPDDEGFCYNN